MLSTKEIYRIQSENNVLSGTSRELEVSLEDYIKECRVFVTENMPEDYNKGNWDEERKNTELKTLITTFINEHKVKVKGYVKQDGVIDLELLMIDVVDYITGEGILKEALEDPDVDEIQINDYKTIFVAKNGILMPLVDSMGREKQFVSNAEIHMLLNKLMNDGTGSVPQFTEGVPLLNAKTAKKQYRINAVHNVANTMDKPPYNFPITSVVIRKFKEINLTLNDLVRTGSITDKMAKFLGIIGSAEMKVFCVGPTGSGKTTLLRIIASAVPADRRMILIQNPTEITFFERDELGRNKRNAVHWEVKEDFNNLTNNSASMENLISNALRATPEVILVGEARGDKEFAQIQRSMQTGHKVLGTFHAEDAQDGVGRFATELSTASGSPRSECVRLVADTIDIIISQFKFQDGSRRVMEISEVIGCDEKNHPIINELFKFELSGEVVTLPNGKKQVGGKHIMLNKISKKMEQAFYKAGFSKSDIVEFLTVNN